MMIVPATHGTERFYLHWSTKRLRRQYIRFVKATVWYSDEGHRREARYIGSILTDRGAMLP